MQEADLPAVKPKVRFVRVAVVQRLDDCAGAANVGNAGCDRSILTGR